MLYQLSYLALRSLSGKPNRTLSITRSQRTLDGTPRPLRAALSPARVSKELEWSTFSLVVLLVIASACNRSGATAPEAASTTGRAGRARACQARPRRHSRTCSRA